MPTSAWIMFGFGCIVLYGGLAACLVIAARNRRARGEPKEDERG